MSCRSSLSFTTPSSATGAASSAGDGVLEPDVPVASLDDQLATPGVPDDGPRALDGLLLGAEHVADALPVLLLDGPAAVRVLHDPSVVLAHLGASSGMSQWTPAGAACSLIGLPAVAAGNRRGALRVNRANAPRGGPVTRSRTAGIVVAVLVAGASGTAAAGERQG